MSKRLPRAERSIPHCGECGGPNEVGALACVFCRAPLATLRCSHCYHLNAPEQEFCSACGELLGLEPLAGVSDAQCPRCDVACEALDGDPGAVFGCMRCGGQFVEHAVLQALLERRRRLQRADAPPRVPLKPDAKIEYLRCPSCRQHMHRRNYGRSSGVIVDVCTAHGIWFDAGELPRVLSFVERGGLVALRRAELGLPPPLTVEDERKQATLIAAELKKHSTARRPLGAADPDMMTGRVVAGVFEGGLAILGAIGDWIFEP